jgi:hypothetical protein
MFLYKGKIYYFLRKIKKYLKKESIIYIFEFFSSLFDKNIRISFTNFGTTNHNFFIIPIKIFENSIYSYKVVKYYNPHIHFFSVFGEKNKINESKALVKIFFTGEETNFNYKEYKGNCIDIVSLSFGFDYIKAENYLRIPLWLLYFFKPNNSKDEIKKILEDFKKHYKKNKFCSLIASHDNSGLRTKIYNEISKIDNIDCPGFLLHNDNSLKEKYNDDKYQYLQQYKFNICPENINSPGYVTEKLFQSLYSGCIPVYNGWSKDPEPEILNPNIILWYDENNTTSLIKEIKKLNIDDNFYNSFINQHFFCDTAVDKIYIYLQKFTDKIQYNYKKLLENNKL